MSDLPDLRFAVYIIILASPAWLLCHVPGFPFTLYHKWGRQIVSTQCLYCVLHAIKRRQGTSGMSEVEWLSQLNISIVFYRHLSDSSAPWVRPRDYLNSMFVLRCAHRWVTTGYHEWGTGITSTPCLYCVLHAIERHQGTMSEAEGLSQLNVCIAFYLCLSDTRVA